MKRKELQEHKTKPLAELKKELAELHEKMISLRLDVSTGKVKNLKEFRNVKKSIAQLETIVGFGEKEGKNAS